VRIADDLSVRFGYQAFQGAVGVGTSFQIILVVGESIAAGAAANLITAWLLGKLRSKDAQVTYLEIDRVTVELKEDEIRRIIQEKIRKKTIFFLKRGGEIRTGKLPVDFRSAATAAVTISSK
jgi:hypothetical protein